MIPSPGQIANSSWTLIWIPSRPLQPQQSHISLLIVSHLLPSPDMLLFEGLALSSVGCPSLKSGIYSYFILPLSPQKNQLSHPGKATTKWDYNLFFHCPYPGPHHPLPGVLTTPPTGLPTCTHTSNPFSILKYRDPN